MPYLWSKKACSSWGNSSASSCRVRCQIRPSPSLEFSTSRVLPTHDNTVAPWRRNQSRMDTSEEFGGRPNYPFNLE
jgi:hypothetical protein